VITADNGQAALDRLQQTTHPPKADKLPSAHRSPLNAQRSLFNDHCSLILSDLMMPIMDGNQLLEKLKSSAATRRIPVIMLTARADVRDKLRALRIGLDDYIIKPFDEEELKVRIANLLQNQAIRQAETITEAAADPTSPAEPSDDQAWLEAIEVHVQANLTSDMLTVATLAAAFTMSESSLLRQLKRLTGLTPLQYLQEMRLDRARQLLENRTDKSVAKVAAAVGYADARSFSRAFKRRFGTLPSDFLTN